jgi:hypothetical protein
VLFCLFLTHAAAVCRELMAADHDNVVVLQLRHGSK